MSSTHRVHCLFCKLALPGNQQPDLEAECGQKKFPLSRSRGRDDTQSYIYRAMHPGMPGSVMKATRKVSAEGEGSSRLLGDRNQYICTHRPAPEAAVSTVHMEPRPLWKSVAGDKREPWDRTALPFPPPSPWLQHSPDAETQRKTEQAHHCPEATVCCWSCAARPSSVLSQCAYTGRYTHTTHLCVHLSTYHCLHFSRSNT